MEFPKGFIWGAGTSSYQIEGAANADGKGPSIWDTFCRKPGAIADGSTGDTATDHYHRFAEDVSLMKHIGLQAYRFSISWPRVLPEGTGRVNEAGMAFYEKLVDLLLENGIQPWVTLFHWDYPQRLFESGGWLNDRSPVWFADYTRLIVDRLSDRVTHWITLNEPQVFIGFGHQTGENAPGQKLPFSDILRISHNSLLAHGKAVQIIRERARKQPFIGVAPVGIISVPSTPTAPDIGAARAATWSIAPDSCWNNAWFGDPMVLGRYPEEGLRLYGDHMPSFPDSDLKQIQQPLDFYGTNIYTADLVQASRNAFQKTPGHDSLRSATGEEAGSIIEPCLKKTDVDHQAELPVLPHTGLKKGDEPVTGWSVVPCPAGTPRTSMDWPVIPESLYWGPRFLHERYQLPIVVTENGMAGHDWVHLDGRVHDPSRIDFLTRYLGRLHQACSEGIPCIGYFHWSLLDNFEWALGAKRRFGLIHVDYQTQTRRLKDSAVWYRTVIQSNGESM